MNTVMPPGTASASCARSSFTVAAFSVDEVEVMIVGVSAAAPSGLGTSGLPG